MYIPFNGGTFTQMKNGNEKMKKIINENPNVIIVFSNTK